MADLSIRYATALFDIGREGSLLGEVSTQAQFIVDALEGEETERFLTHPRITTAQKSAFLEDTFGGHIHESLSAFMNLALAKNREAFILPTLRRLVAMIREHMNFTTARIVSAVQLSDAQLSRIASTLNAKLGKQVDVTVNIDPAVIAGLSIQVDGFFLDRTVRTMLRDMKENVRRGAAI
jgi:F-type H+-transporting ATPase subunit delta